MRIDGPVSGTGLLVLRVVAVLIIGVGLVALYGAARLYVRNKSAHKWPTVPGTILHSSFESRRVKGADDKRTVVHRADILYTYEVNGKVYESEQVQLGGTSETSIASGHKRRADKYVDGAQVKVYYDPTDPGMATLEPGETGGIVNLAIVGGGFVLVGTIVIVLSIIAPHS
jgi:hypothetical protein